MEAQSKKRTAYFETFKKKHGIPDKFSMDVLFKEVPKLAEAFDDFVNEQEGALEAEADEQFDPESEYFNSMSEDGDDD